MKIKKVDEKPIVIHQKKNPRIHLHKGIREVRHKKVANTVRISRKSDRKAKEKEATIIVACHDKEELELIADEIFVMENGKIMEHKS